MPVILQLELMLPHRIRLRGPWQAGPLTLRLPDEFDQLAGRTATLTRHFGWPSPLAPHERVWLVLDGLTARCEAWLNDQRLDALQPPVERDITSLLRERNELRIDVPAGTRWDEAALEVRAQAWLSRLSARRHQDRLVVRGRLNGTADGRLDLYAILNRRTVMQTALEPNGRWFELSSEPLPAELWEPTVHVELMSGAAVWHAADIPLADT